MYRSSPSPSRPSAVRGPAPRSSTARTVPSPRGSASTSVTGPAHPARTAVTNCACRRPHSARVRPSTSARLSQPPSSRPEPTGTGSRIRSGRGSQANTDRRATTICSAAASTRRCPSVLPATRNGSSAVPSRSSGSGARVTGVAPAVCQAACTARREGSRSAVSSRTRPPDVSRSPTIRRSGSACTATSSRIGPSGPSAVQPIRKPRRRWASGRARSGTHACGSTNTSPSSAPPPSRASASYARSALVLPQPLGPENRVSGPSGNPAPRWEANADSRSSVRWGRRERWSPGAGSTEEVSAARGRPCDGTTGSAETADVDNAEDTAISGP